MIEEPNERELFEELRRDVSDADVVRVSDADWLLGDEFRRDVEELLEYARDRGIRVEYV